MACLEHFCTNELCKWSDQSNVLFLECPLCGGHVMNWFDEDGDL